MKKYIVVTGASKGLGLDICSQLVKADFKVIAISRTSSPELQKLIESYDVGHFQFDLGNTSKIKSLCDEILKNHGRPYGLINNAALGNDGILATMHETDIEASIDVNITAPILLTKYLSRSMLINRAGRIINISSIIATTGYNGLSVYAATKSSLIGFTKSLSREIGKGGITVNCVAPGYMETEMTKGLTGEKLESIKRRSAMKTLVSCADVSGAVLYLLSDSAKLVTGTTITVDAGSTA